MRERERESKCKCESERESWLTLMHLNVRRQLLRKNGQLIFKLKYLIQLKSQSHQH